MLNLDPIDYTIGLGHHNVARGHQNCERLGLEFDDLANVRVLRRHMEELLLVCAQEYAALTIPCQGSERYARVNVAFIDGDVQGIKFFNFEAPSVDKVVLSGFTIPLILIVIEALVLEGRQDCVELHLVS